MPARVVVESKSSSAAATMMTSIHERRNMAQRAINDDITARLARRSYHLPGYSVKCDYLQYMFNNHPILGICCHNSLHPLRYGRRVLILLGSFAFGIAVTNAIYLWYVAVGRDASEEVLAIDSGSRHIALTHGALILVTIGSGSHALFDRFVWGLAVCCSGRNVRSRKRCNFGGHIIVFIVMAIVAIATGVALVRVSVDDGEIVADGKSPTKEDVQHVLDFDNFKWSDYAFLKAYAIEFSVSLFVYYPLIETILFSGLLGCRSSAIPILGGRPGQMARERKAQSQGEGVEVVLGGVVPQQSTTLNNTRPNSSFHRASTTTSATTLPMTNHVAMGGGVGQTPLPPPPPTSTLYTDSNEPVARPVASRYRPSLPTIPSGKLALPGVHGQRPPPTANYFGTINARLNDDVSTLGEPDMGNGMFYPVPHADITVGESLLSAGDRMYGFGLVGGRQTTGGGGGGLRRLDSLDENTTIANKTTFNDDDTVEVAYRTDPGNFNHKINDGDYQRLVVIAPSGILGLVLDNVTGNLPIVHAVKDGSLLAGRLQKGDFLLSVDEIDCHGMSAREVSDVITDRGHRSERRLVLLRRRTSPDDYDDDEEIGVMRAAF